MDHPQEGMKRLRDIEERKPHVQRPMKAVFFAPHTSERQATHPLISDLSDILGYRGVICGAHSVEDMKHQLLSMSAKLSKMGFSKKEANALDGMFRLKDALLRLGMVSGILETAGPATLIEVHALERDYSFDDMIPCADFFIRLPGTRALFLKDFRYEYFGLLDRWLPVLDDIEENGGKNLRSALEILGLDSWDVSMGLPSMVETLKRMGDRCALLGVPAPSEYDDGFKVATRFERTYGQSHSFMHTLSGREVLAIADLLT
ncbi:MAG: hypothetical protein V1827_01805 [Candidatus Micrarchaeota archaeon]